MGANAAVNILNSDARNNESAISTENRIVPFSSEGPAESDVSYCQTGVRNNKDAATDEENLREYWINHARSLCGEGRVAKKPLYYRFIKRAFDVLFSSCVIVFGLIPGLILSAFIVKDTGGSPIYTSERVGRGGVPFRVYKFRSMVSDSDNLEKYFSTEQLEEWHREHKVENDPRITKLGAFLRSSSIDEFPQFINVFLGQISVVGPRAITFEELSYFGDDQDLLLSCPPGITGLWQTGPRNLATFEIGLRQELELMYARNASLSLDAKLFFRTFATMISGTGR